MSLQTQSLSERRKCHGRYNSGCSLVTGNLAVLAVFLLLYVVKENEKRDLRQEERERNYQAIISQLTEKLNILDEVENGIADIKSFLSAKLTDTPEKPEKDSRT